MSVHLLEHHLGGGERQQKDTASHARVHLDKLRPWLEAAWTMPVLVAVALVAAQGPGDGQALRVVHAAASSRGSR